MKQRLFLIITVLLVTTFASTVTAQSVVTDNAGTSADNIGTPADSVGALPEGMKVDADQLMSDYQNRTNLAAATDNARDEGMTDAVLRDRLARIPTVIDLPLNDITRPYIAAYAARMRRSVSIMLGASNFYMPIIEEALERHNLPLELRYLPVIESALRPAATSKTGAAGLWQFMLATGKRYGLEVNTLVDERRDAMKASEAAAQFLSDLYEQFGDWGLALAAYNCGEMTVQKALVRAGGGEGKDFWSIYNYLPAETRGYYPAFVAANYIMTYYCEHGITPMDATLPAASDTVVVAHDTRFDQIAPLCNVTVDELRALNPQYRRDVVPMHYAVSLPAQSVEAFLLHEDSIYGLAAGTSTSTETAATTAAGAGDVALTPTDPTANAPEQVAPARPANTRGTSRSSRRRAASTRSVSVRSGDTLSTIAARNGTTVSRLRQLNGISGSMIRPGQKLRVK